MIVDVFVTAEFVDLVVTLKVDIELASGVEFVFATEAMFANE